MSPKTLLTFCTNGVLLRTVMAGEQSLSTVTHIIVVSYYKHFILLSALNSAHHVEQLHVVNLRTPNALMLLSKSGK